MANVFQGPATCLLAALLAGWPALLTAGTASDAAARQDAQASQPAAPTPETPTGPGKLVVTVGKSLVIDSPINIQRVSVANGDLVEAVAVGPKEVLINGKSAGETSLIVWQQGGNRLLYDLTVRLSPFKLDAVRQQLARDFPEDDINVTYDNDTVFVRGKVKDVIAAERVMAIAATLGKSVNLLHVTIPVMEPQILLRVRFANVDRGASTDLGMNLASGAFGQSTSIGTGQFSGPTIDDKGNFTLSDALNIFLFRKDLNLAATIKALESKRLLETLAEPNLLAINGKPANFLSGGEFPFPMIQGGANAGAVTIAFREFGIRINFLPTVTPRGTIRLQVAPEVSALDYTHAVTFQGFTIPAMSTRRVNTEVELEDGQAFVIAGLMDNSLTETLNRIPGLANIPLLGKLFQSKSVARSNSELLVIVTPELVRPIPAGQPAPDLNYPSPFLPQNTKGPMNHPTMQTGAAPQSVPTGTVPFEQLARPQRTGQAVPEATVAPQPAAQPAPSPAMTAPAAGAPVQAPTSSPEGGSGK